MSTNTQSKAVTLIIAAGAIAPINAEGENFHVVFSPVDLAIKFPGGEFVLHPQGSGVDNLPGGQTFKRLEVRNPSLGEITAVVYIGGPLYRDNRSAIIEPKTEFAAQASATLAAATGVTLSGLPTGFRIRRKSIQVTNLDPNLTLQVRDSAGQVGLTVFASTSIILPISEAVEIYNANGAAQALNISEIWWTL